MRVVISDGYMDKLVSLKRADERKSAKECVQKFAKNPLNPPPGLNLEALGGLGGLYSMRVSRDVRIILHKEPEEWVILHVGPHDEAYRWAKRTKFQRHSHTGGIQVVHTENLYQEGLQAVAEERTSALFENCDDEYLLSLGVPEEALPAVQNLANEQDFTTVCERLPEDVSERLLGLYLGEPIEVPEPIPQEQSPFDTPEARRQFFVVENQEELERALDAPWAEWLVFLHPLQLHAAREDFRGPVKITGTAGTGKTVVALHRAKRLAELGRRVLLTTYSNTLTADLERKLDLLCGSVARANINVGTVHSVAFDILKRAGGHRPGRADAKRIGELLDEAASRVGVEFSSHFLRTEWSRVVSAQGIETWEQYRSAPRSGRGIPLRVRERLALWGVFEEARMRLKERGISDFPDICRMAREKLEDGSVDSPYDAVVVDEVQDLNPQEILLLKAIGGTGENGLTFIGDGGQRIYPGGFSLRSLGIEVRGRSRKLLVNYRTSEQIRRFADRVLGEDYDDLDEGTENRSGTRNLFSGPEPEVRVFSSSSEEDEWVAKRISDLLDEGFDGDRIGVFARVNYRLRSVESALHRWKIEFARLKDNEDFTGDQRVRLGTMHRVKGLEFQAVFVVSTNRGLLPHRNAVDDPDDSLEWREAYRRERQLLYVNITRARELVHISCHDRPSPFLLEAGMVEEEGTTE